MVKPRPSKVQAWVKISKKYTAKILNLLRRMTTTRRTALRLSPKAFDLVSVHLQVSDDHFCATMVEWFVSPSPWNT